MRPGSTLALAAVLVAITGCSGAATDDSKLANLRGKGFGGTPPLFPEHPWTVKYAWDCSKQIAEGRAVLQQVRVDVKHADDGSDVENKSLTQRKGKKGDGVLTYDRPGAYVVSITTECEWRLRVDEQRGGA